VTKFEEQILSSTKKRQNLRKHLASGLCIQPASVFDPVSARLADSLGFSVAMLAGSATSAIVLGAPDIALLSINDLVEQAKRITRVSNLSLIVDADNGYGNSLNVMMTIRELEIAGVAAVTIEDTVLPQRKGAKGEHLIEMDELISKTKAALEARIDPETVIVGRTHALRTSGIDEANTRVKTLATLGVDAIFVVGVNSLEDLKSISKSAMGLPVMLGGSEVDVPENELANHNVSIIIKGHPTLQASVQAIYKVLLAQSSNELQSLNDSELASPEIMNIALGKNYFQTLNQKFLN